MPCSSSPASRRISCKFAGLARTKVGEELNLVDKDRFELAWIVDFPMYEYNETRRRSTSPTTRFRCRRAGSRRSARPRIRSTHQGVPVRHQSATATKSPRAASAIIVPRRWSRRSRSRAMAKRCGRAVRRHVPRLPVWRAAAWRHRAPASTASSCCCAATTTCAKSSLFPMNQRAEDLLMGAPSEATPKQLRELHIRLNLPQG